MQRSPLSFSVYYGESIVGARQRLYNTNTPWKICTINTSLDLVRTFSGGLDVANFERLFLN